MSLFTGEPGLVMLFLAQVLFIVLQIIILLRLTKEMHEADRSEPRPTSTRAKTKAKRRR